MQQDVIGVSTDPRIVRPEAMSFPTVFPGVFEDVQARFRSTTTQRRLHRGMQTTILLILVAGVVNRNLSVVVNAAFALGVTLLPSFLARDFDVRLGSGLELIITFAVLLHSLGMIGLYDHIWWWDHLTHVLSGALVASVGYATARAFDDYSDAVTFPREFLAIYVFLFTVAVGVLWELVEQVGREIAIAWGFDPILVVYGLEDTMWDLVFDMIGAVVVALFARRELEGTVTALRRVLERASEPPE
jgi:hypothetical protein